MVNLELCFFFNYTLGLTKAAFDQRSATVLLTAKSILAVVTFQYVTSYLEYRGEVYKHAKGCSYVCECEC